jgi:ribose 5-phosphate isomerase B
MKFYIANDHAGVNIKQHIISYLESQKCEVINLGTNSNERVDYTDFAHLLSKKVLDDSGSFGILICGTGIGMSLVANKYKGIRAALCHDNYTAKMARAHNDANILCLGERVVGLGEIESILEAWLNQPFEAGRHQKRVEKIDID